MLTRSEPFDGAQGERGGVRTIEMNPVMLKLSKHELFRSPRANDTGLPRLPGRHEAEPISERNFCALDVHEPCGVEPASIFLLGVGLAHVKGV